MESLKDIKSNTTSTSYPERVIKKAKGVKKYSLAEGIPATQVQEQPILVRVKRTRESEPVEQIEMEFDL